MALLADAARASGREPHFTILGAWEQNERYPLTFDYPVDECFFFSKALLPGSDFRKTLRACDLVFDIGGGDSFADIYGLQRYTYLLLTKQAVHDPGRRLILAPQTVGPFESAFAKFTAPRMMARARSVWARDQLSFNKLGTIAPKATARRATDVAFSLPFTRPDAARAGSKTRIGINASALLYRESAGGPSNRFGLRQSYCELMDGVLQNLTRRADVSCVLVPHVVSSHNSSEDDYTLARELGAKFGIEVAPRFGDPIAAKSFIAGTDLLIGSRMHAAIAALSAGVPALPLGYSDKFVSIFSELGYPISIDLRTARLDDVTAKLDDLLGRLDTYRTYAGTAADNAGQRLELYKVYLRELMATLP